MSAIKDTSAASDLKQAAALRAAGLIKSGARVGLGTGSTAAFAIRELGRRVREEGLAIRCVATSFQARVLAREVGLSPEPIEHMDELDVSIDGADEIDPALNLIKGGGAAHTLEKLVHAMTREFIVVADESKLVSRLGERFSVPVEILADALGYARKRLLELGALEVILRTAVRKDGPVVTDNGNLVLDARFNIDDPERLEREINLIPGVVENGVFSGAVRPARAFVAGKDSVRELSAS